MSTVYQLTNLVMSTGLYQLTDLVTVCLGLYQLTDPVMSRSISADWDGMPGNLDASFTWSNGRTYFFKVCSKSSSTIF